VYRFTRCEQSRAESLGCCAARYQGNVSAALVLGGVDLRGPHLFTARLALPGPLAAVWQSLSRKYPPWRMPGSSQVPGGPLHSLQRSAWR